MASVPDGLVAASLDSRALELIILPTEKCNFRCTYCYEDFAIGRMRPAIVGALKQLISRRAEDLRHLSLSWFGGEPLLAAPVIFDIAEHALALSEAHGFQVSGGLTTNGHLLNEQTLQRLVSLCQDFFQITLDGDEAEHNLTRRLANGRGTFDTIWKNLLMIRDSGVQCRVALRLHITPSNIPSVERLIDRINQELSACGKFKVHFHRVSNLGGAGGQTVRELGWEEYGRLVAGLSKKLFVHASSEHQLADEGYICYAAKPNSLLIRADGRVGKCTVALDDPRNHVGDLLPDGTIDFVDERLRLWFEGFRTMDAGILGCPLPSLKPLPTAEPSRVAIPAELV